MYCCLKLSQDQSAAINYLQEDLDFFLKFQQFYRSFLLEVYVLVRFWEKRVTFRRRVQGTVLFQSSGALEQFLFCRISVFLTWQGITGCAGLLKQREPQGRKPGMWFHLETAACKDTDVRREGKHLPLVMSTVLIAPGVGWSTAGAFHIPQGPNEQLHQKTQQRLVWDGAWLQSKGTRRRRRRFPGVPASASPSGTGWAQLVLPLGKASGCDA